MEQEINRVITAIILLIAVLLMALFVVPSLALLAV